MEVRSLLTGNRYVSLPFSDYCDPLAGDGVGQSDAISKVLEYGHASGWNTLQFRLAETPFGRESESSGRYYHHVLDLTPGEDRLFSSFRESTRRNIRKAVKEGVVLSVSDKLSDMETFCRLNCLTRRRHGLPPQPYRFFRNLHEFMISRGGGIVVLGFLEGNPVAGAVFLHVGRKSYFKYGASDKKFQNLRANNLVMWEAIRWYVAKGYSTMCFGRNEEWNGNLRRYKNAWGTVESEMRYYNYDFGAQRFVRKNSNIKGIHNAVFRLMPLPLSRLIGTALYRHMA
jgi:hypothetical protein